MAFEIIALLLGVSVFANIVLLVEAVFTNEMFRSERSTKRRLLVAFSDLYDGSQGVYSEGVAGGSSIRLWRDLVDAEDPRVLPFIDEMINDEDWKDADIDAD